MPVSYCCVVDRAYKRYTIPTNPTLTYLHHPSGVTVLALNEDHEPLQSEVVMVDFAMNKKGTERGTQQVSGKGKKGALLIQKETRLCIIRCKDGTERVIRAGVKGTMVEVNDRLKTNPDLIRTAPENQGYICIVTYGAGKRKVDEFEDLEQQPPKKIPLRDLPLPLEKESEKETVVPEDKQEEATASTSEEPTKAPPSEEEQSTV